MAFLLILGLLPFSIAITSFVCSLLQIPSLPTCSQSSLSATLSLTSARFEPVQKHQSLLDAFHGAPSTHLVFSGPVCWAPRVRTASLDGTGRITDGPRYCVREIRCSSSFRPLCSRCLLITISDARPHKYIGALRRISLSLWTNDVDADSKEREVCLYVMPTRTPVQLSS